MTKLGQQVTVSKLIAINVVVTRDKLTLALSRLFCGAFCDQTIHPTARVFETRSSATAEKQRVSCPHGGTVGLDRPAPSPSVRSGYTYAYG